MRTLVLSCLLAASSLVAGTAFAEEASPPLFGPTEKAIVLKYAENGHWYSHLLVYDGEGWPDTLEKRAYGTESQAEARIEWLKRTTGAIEQKNEPSRGALSELRTPLLGEVWTATEVWTPEWETKFAEWTRANFDRDFFARYGVSTDCADAAIALRWIFARIHALPAGNRLAGNGALITNRSVRTSWRNLPTAEKWYEDRRFRAALDYVLDTTYTHSLLADSYPLAISADTIREGVFHLEMRASDGHTRVISKIHRDGGRWPIEILYSDVPRRVRRLVQQPLTVYNQPRHLFGGLVGHRWVKLTPTSASLIPAAAMPGYSLEQFRPDFFRGGDSNYSDEVARRLQESLDPLLGMRAMLDNLREALADRKDVVAEGFEICSRLDCTPGSENYESWSTPSRDARIGGYFAQIRTYLEGFTGDDLRRARKLYKKRARKKILKVGGQKLRYRDLEKIWAERKFSSDPKDPPAKRWGLK